MRGKKQISGYVMILSGAALWGFLPLFTRLLYATGLNPVQVSSVRGYLAAILAFVFFILQKRYREFRMREIPFYLLYGIFAIGCSFVLYAVSIGMLPTAMAAILLYTGPAFVNVLERIFYGIPITPPKWAALLLTFLGCGLVVRIYDAASFQSNLVGILVGLGSGFCYSLTTVLGTKVKGRHPGQMNAYLILIWGSAVFCVVQPPWTLPQLDAGQLLLCVGLAVVCSLVPYALYLAGMDRGIDGGIASIIATVEPVVATLLGVLVFHDEMDLLQVLGILIVLAGVILPIFSEKVTQVK